MNKEDGTRDAFISRFDSGALVEMDFDAYHVRLIARLIGYELPASSVHEHFGRFYFSSNNLTDAEYEQSKQITFRLLYGGIDREFLSVPFFAHVNDFIIKLWTQWKTLGFIETALDRRIISREQFPDMTKNKLFNYYLQSLETEVSVRKLNQVLEYLTEYNSCIVLYTYDSVLFDIDPTEAKKIIPEVRSLLESGNLPVKCSVGTTYDYMNVILF
jgi:hypothetical protein